jgi:hypothetical protein
MVPPVGKVDAVSQRRVGFNFPHTLHYGHGFSRKLGFFNMTPRRTRQSQIRSNAYAGLQDNEIAGNNVPSLNLEFAAVADNSCARGDELHQGPDRLLSTTFLGKPDDRVEKQYGHDDTSIDELFEDKGDEGCDDENVDE